MRRKRAVGVATLVLLLAAVLPLWAADLPISVASLSSPVAPFTDATIQIQTSPGAACTITVLYKSGPSRDLPPQNWTIFDLRTEPTLRPSGGTGGSR